LYKVLIDQNPVGVIEQIKAAKLRGRGGAGYLTGNKWEFLQKAAGPEKYLICNADEGDPGAYMNRNEIESDPHSLLEGMIIAGYVTGANKGIVYVRAEYPLAVLRLERALEQARPMDSWATMSLARLRFRHRDGGGRRRLRVRRGDSPHWRRSRTSPAGRDRARRSLRRRA